MQLRTLVSALALVAGAASPLFGEDGGRPYDTAPTWSAEGRKIYFYAYRSGNGDLLGLAPGGPAQPSTTQHNPAQPSTTSTAQTVTGTYQRQSRAPCKSLPATARPMIFAPATDI